MITTRIMHMAVDKEEGSGQVVVRYNLTLKHTPKQTTVMMDV
jgi:hypothetical protein